MSTWVRRILDWTSAAAVLTAVGIRFALVILNIRWNILAVDTSTESQLATVQNLASAANIALMVNITFFSIIFCTKLAHAILQRRKMGMKQFGPMQIIFVMGCQTLVIPGEFRSSCPPPNLF